MTLTPADLQRLIRDDPRATGRVLQWVGNRGLRHSPNITGATLAAVCGISGRTWRRWMSWHESDLPKSERPGQPMPAAAWRLLVEVSGVDVGGQMEAA